MSSNELEIFLQLPSERPKVVRADSSVTLRTLLTRHGVENDGTHDILAYVGECDEALMEDHESHRPVDLDLTLKDIELDKHHYLHCSHCHEIDTFIHFSGKELNRKFSPTTTVEVVTRWARMKQRLDMEAASEFVLQLSNTEKRPRQGKYLGELVQDTECKLSFDLVKEETPQG